MVYLKQLIFTEGVVCSKNYYKYFTEVNTLKPYNNPKKLIQSYAHYTAEEIEIN